jgi:hypothetical protein
MTFESTPAAYSSVNDFLVYVAYDAHAADPVTYPNYKYVGEIWVNGTQVFTGKYFPNPVSNRGIMDFGSVIREYVTATFSPSSNVINAQELGQNSWQLSIVIKIREEYSGSVGAVVLTDSARIYFNHFNGRISNFTNLANYNDDVLSDRTSPITLTFGTNFYFIPYFAESSSTYNVVITGGTSTRTKVITPSAVNTMQMINISPGAINAEYAGNFTASTETYSVQIGSKTYVVNIVCNGMYQNYMMHFMNQWGGFESFLFNKVSKKTIEVERKSWNQLPYRVNGSGVVSVKTGNVMHKQKTQFAGRFKEKLRLNSDWVTDSDYEFLQQLITSADVYVEDAGTFYPVMITNNNYDRKIHLVDGLINFTIDVEFATTYKTQFA